MARSRIARNMVALGGRPELRHGFVTDNGNEIVDVFDLAIDDPVALETTINQMPGVVTNGLIAARGADVLIVASDGGVERIT